MAVYSTKQHSVSLKALDSQIDSIKENKAKELIYNICRPIKAMNDQIYGMTTDYHGFVDDPASNAVLCQIQSLNAQILEILHRTFAHSESEFVFADSKSNTDSTDKVIETTVAAVSEEIMPLSSLIRVLTPNQYNEELLCALISKHSLSTNTVLRADHRPKVLVALKECSFTDNEAELLLTALAENLGTSADAFGVKVVDLTLAAIEGVFEGALSVERSEIGRIYGAHCIDTIQLSAMTEQRFTELLKQCAVHGGVYAQFSKSQCVKVHRAIKMLLNAPQRNRYDIDVAEAALYLLANNEALKKKQLTVDATQIRAAFEGCSARRVMENGKKAFIRTLAATGNGEIKIGYGTKVWNGLKQWVEDSNANVPQRVLIKDYMEVVEKAGDADDAKEEESETPKAAVNRSLG